MPTATSSAPARLRPLLRWVVWLLAFSPVLYMAGVVREYAVDVGCWDMWENAALLAKWKDGALGWSDLYAAQIQHRIVIPRVLIILLHTLSGGDFRWENYFTFGVLGATAVMVWRLLRQTCGPSSWLPGLVFGANLLLVSPMLYQTTLWGSGMWMTLPLPCLLAALLILHRPWPFWLKVAAAAVLTEVATHSFAHGFGVWPVLITYIALQPKLGPIGPRLTASALLAALAAATAALYFHNFVNQAYHAYTLRPGDPALSGSLSHSPGQVLTVLLGYLGTLFARRPFDPHPPIDTAPLVGAALLGGFIILVAVLLGTRRGRALWSPALPWLAVGAYTIGVGVMIGLGRAHTGEFRAVTPRYLLVSHCLWIATGAVLFLMARAFTAGWPERGRELARRAGVGALVAAAVLQLPVWQYGLHLTRVWSRARWQAVALVMFIEHFAPEQERATRNVLDRDYTYCRDAVRTLRRLNLFKIPVLDEPDLHQFSRSTSPLPADRAGIESAVTGPDGRLDVRGHARFGLDRPPDLVLFCLPEEGGSHRVVGLGQPLSTPALRLYGLDYEFANADPLPQSLWHRWVAHLEPAKLPVGATSLELWALDARARRVTRLVAPLTVTKSADGTLRSDFAPPATGRSEPTPQ